MKKDCRSCEHYESIGPGYGMCMMDELPVIVVADYEPAKNFLQCENKKMIVSTAYGEMNKEEKQ